MLNIEVGGEKIGSELMLGAAVAEEAEEPSCCAGQLDRHTALFLSSVPINLSKEYVHTCYVLRTGL